MGGGWTGVPNRHVEEGERGFGSSKPGLRYASIWRGGGVVWVESSIRMGATEEVRVEDWTKRRSKIILSSEQKVSRSILKEFSSGIIFKAFFQSAFNYTTSDCKTEGSFSECGLHRVSLKTVNELRSCHIAIWKYQRTHIVWNTLGMVNQAMTQNEFNTFAVVQVISAAV